MSRTRRRWLRVWFGLRTLLLAAGGALPTYARNLPLLRGTEVDGRPIDRIDAALASGTKGGYRFDTTGGTFSFTATAVPISDWHGERCFFVDQSGVITIGIRSPSGRVVHRVGERRGTEAR